MWQVKEVKTILETRPFCVEEISFADSAPPYFRLNCPDWVNACAVTADRQVILIEQMRSGVLKTVLETPGGVMDPDEKDPTLAVARELEEETGFTSCRLLPLASINPNPAIMNNRCHFFLALDCVPTVPRKHFPDCDEKITVRQVPLVDVGHLIRTNQLNHALSALCIMLSAKYLNISF